jgi:hypothetical protein
MNATTTTVVTPARFKQGLSYAEFLAQSPINHDKFEHYYNHPVLTEDDFSFFRNVATLPNGPRKLMVIAEAWCGDVYRELPTAVRIAEAAGLELRIFLRDQNPDIMDEFLSNEGKSRAIPVLAFYTDDMRYITHFTERSVTAHRELGAALSESKARLGLQASAGLETLSSSDRHALIRELLPLVEPHLDEWRKQAVEEIRDLLSKALQYSHAK